MALRRKDVNVVDIEVVAGGSLRERNGPLICRAWGTAPDLILVPGDGSVIWSRLDKVVKERELGSGEDGVMVEHLNVLSPCKL